ncbi:MAG TPA: hypothetical protein DCZ34_03030 [Clostridiales bacterium]|nr:hypothetical protein [Clostridiales bacterium]
MRDGIFCALFVEFNKGKGTMKNKIILNIPHSSLQLSKEFLQAKKVLNDDEIENFNLQMTDLFTDKLFSCKNFSHIKAKYSRIVCDVEKFVDDKKEIMAKYGLGVIYKNNLKQKQIFSNLDMAYREKILNKYYFPYHKKLDNVVGKYLNGMT